MTCIIDRRATFCIFECGDFYLPEVGLIDNPHMLASLRSVSEKFRKAVVTYGLKKSGRMIFMRIPAKEEELDYA